MAELSQEEFDRRLDAIQQTFWGRRDQPLPSHAELDAAHAALVALARDPAVREDRARKLAIHAVAEVLERTYAARKLPVPEES